MSASVFHDVVILKLNHINSDYIKYYTKCMVKKIRKNTLFYIFYTYCVKVQTYTFIIFMKTKQTSIATKSLLIAVVVILQFLHTSIIIKY